VTYFRVLEGHNHLEYQAFIQPQLFPVITFPPRGVPDIRSVGIYQAVAEAPYYSLVNLLTNYIIAGSQNNANKFHPILEIISREFGMISRFIKTILTYLL
jgi:hypothetical protein